MRAVTCHRYGVVAVEEIETPPLTDDGVLVRVHASSVNPADRYSTIGIPRLMRPMMGFRKPRESRVGTDFAGTVEAVGKDVTEFAPGDDVFGGKSGAYADFVCVSREKAIAIKPARVSFEQAGSVGVAGLTALQGLRDKAGVKQGQRVLVNGASGGVGTFAVQIAKALGAEVTGVCSPRNVELVQSLRADRVIDYTTEDFTRSDERYDVIFDVAGSRSWSECRRVLAPNGIVIMVGAKSSGGMLGPLGHLIRFRLASMRGSQKASFFIANFNQADIVALGELMESGQLTPAIDKTYPLSEIADAFDYLGEGHARAKIAITM